MDASMMSKFLPGMDLCEAFYHEVVSPIIEQRFPGLVYSAAKLHHGSDVLGFDTPQSMDHDWGPSRIDLFLREVDCHRLSEEVGSVLSSELPHVFRGLPTDFRSDDEHAGIVLVAEGPVLHRINCTTTDRFFHRFLGFSPLDPIGETDWLTVSPHYLRMIASGKVFHDGLGELRAAQDALRWYPSDVWLYLLSCQWGRIDQEEAFMARCGDVGDELGSRLVASRMVEELMKLCFLMERQYWTFSKWFGTAFSRLECAATLTPVFDAVLSSTGWKEREKHLSEAYVDVGIMHNTLGITTFIEPNVSQFYDRPYQVPHAERYCFALRDCIQSDTVLSWPKYVGGVGQFVHSTDVLCSTVHCKRIGAIYE